MFLKEEDSRSNNFVTLDSNQKQLYTKEILGDAGQIFERHSSCRLSHVWEDGRESG
jgi:hypothetical protein